MQMDAKVCGLISHVQYLSQVNYVLCGLLNTHSRGCHKVEWGIPSADCGSIEGYTWTSTQYHVFRADCMCENTMFIQTSKHRIAKSYQQGVWEHSLNCPRGPVAK